MRIEFNERYATKNSNKATLSLHFVFKVPQAIQADGTASHDNLSTASHEVVQLEQFAEESLDPNPLLNISTFAPAIRSCHLSPVSTHQNGPQDFLAFREHDC